MVMMARDPIPASAPAAPRPVPRDMAGVAARLSGGYILRTYQLMAQETDGDLILSLIFRAILAANVDHLDKSLANGPQYCGVDDLPPDNLRRPVSVLAIADSLGLSYETVRRHVLKLMEAGRCIRVKGGVVVPASALRGEDHVRALQVNLVNLRRLYRSLKLAGVDLGDD